MSHETEDRIESMIEDPSFDAQEWMQESHPSPYEMYLYRKLTRNRD